MFEIEENKKKHSIAFTIIGIFVMIAAVAGVSVAAYTWQYASNNASSISTGSINMRLLESTDSINITDALPMKDVMGKKQGQKFDFAVTTYASGSPGNISYSLKIDKVSVDSGYNALPNSSVKVYLTALTENGEVEVMKPVLVSTIITSGNSGALTFNTDKTNYLVHNHNTANSSISTKYRLRMWVDEGVEASNWTADTKNQFKLKISALGTLGS